MTGSISASCHKVSICIRFIFLHIFRIVSGHGELWFLSYWHETVYYIKSFCIRSLVFKCRRLFLMMFFVSSQLYINPATVKMLSNLKVYSCFTYIYSSYAAMRADFWMQQTIWTIHNLLIMSVIKPEVKRGNFMTSNGC